MTLAAGRARAQNATTSASKKLRKPKPKIVTELGQKDERPTETTESPTTVTMRSSFLIKNADPSFEKSYQMIKKKALERERQGLPQNDYDESLTKQQGKRPPARDGHTGIVLGECMFVFGGDRHCMPFNDFHMLNIKGEFKAKQYLF